MQEEEGAPPLGFDEITVERESGGGGGGGSPAGNRWPRQETTALLKIRSDMDPLFQEATLKAPLWELISRKLREEGYQRSAKKCKEKFENVFKYYKRTKEARAGKSYRFFSQLEAFRTSAAAAAAVLPPPIMSGSDTMVNIEATSSGAAAPSQHALFSITDPPPPPPPPPPPAAVAHITTPAIAPPPTDGPCSSSNPSSYSGTESENESRRKRKRKLHSGEEAPAESSKMMAFFEGLIQKVIDQQEKMLQKFLEAIERREQNRMIREEAWRRQEKSRLSKEHELAAEEHAAAASRDDAIVSFLQKLTGQKIPFPPPPPSPTAAGEDTPTPTPPPPENHPVPPPKVTPLSSSRWPKPEVHALIKLRSGMELRYQESIPKGPLWEEISSGMLCLGYNRSAKRCKEKWENINKYFKKVKESTKSRRDDAKTCPYFHQLDALYRNKLTGGVSGGGGGGSSAAADDRLSSVLAVKKKTL